jgi:hypothetical protein
LFPAQPPKLPGEFLSLVRHTPLVVPASPGLTGLLQLGRAFAHPLIFLLLTTGQLPESLQGSIDVFVDLLLLTPLDTLVLVPQLIEFEFEQVGQVFGIWRLAPATTATALTLAHLDITECGIRTL